MGIQADSTTRLYKLLNTDNVQAIITQIHINIGGEKHGINRRAFN